MPFAPDVALEPYWYIDSSATHPVTSYSSSLDAIQTYTRNDHLMIRDGKCLSISHLGSGYFHLSNNYNKSFLMNNDCF